MNSLVGTTQAAWIVLVPFFHFKGTFCRSDGNTLQVLSNEERESESPAEAGQAACASTPGGKGGHFLPIYTHTSGGGLR